MDIEALRTFLLLSQNKSFTKTAEALHVVQSTVSIRIKELEEELGKTLFERNNRHVKLTVAGSLYVDYAERLISLFDESKTKLYTSQYFDKTLTIGGLDMIWRCFLFNLSKKYLQKNPTVSLRAITYNTNYISQLLLDNAIDVAFICHPLKTPKIVCLSAFSDDVVFVASPEHALAKKPFAKAEELADIPLIYGDIGNSFTAWYERNLASSHNLRVKFDIVSLMLPFLLEGYGPGFVLRSLVEKELKSGALIEIPLASAEPLPRWMSYLAFDKSKGEKLEISNLIAIMRELHHSC